MQRGNKNVKRRTVLCLLAFILGVNVTVNTSTGPDVGSLDPWGSIRGNEAVDHRRGRTYSLARLSVISFRFSFETCTYIDCDHYVNTSDEIHTHTHMRTRIHLRRRCVRARARKVYFRERTTSWYINIYKYKYKYIYIYHVMIYLTVR